MLRTALFALLCAALTPVMAGAGPVAGPDGVLRYPFGQRTPTLRCKPLFVCDLVLEPGETIVNVAVGDSVRWLVAPASSGDADHATPHVLLKPTQTGLHTNLIVTTTQHTYDVALVSSDSDPMPRIGFLYPHDPQPEFSAAHGVRPDAPPVETVIDKLDFNYRMSGDRTLQPVRVFNDGTHTYLQMPQDLREVPVLFAIGSDGGDSLVNYRFTGQYYVVDGVPESIALVEGSGKHQRRALVSRGS